MTERYPVQRRESTKSKRRSNSVDDGDVNCIGHGPRSHFDSRHDPDRIYENCKQSSSLEDLIQEDLDDVDGSGSLELEHDDWVGILKASFWGE